MKEWRLARGRIWKEGEGEDELVEYKRLGGVCGSERSPAVWVNLTGRRPLQVLSLHEFSSSFS
jgi:hypothetical protein